MTAACLTAGLPIFIEWKGIFPAPRTCAAAQLSPRLCTSAAVPSHQECSSPPLRRSPGIDLYACSDCMVAISTPLSPNCNDGWRPEQAVGVLLTMTRESVQTPLFISLQHVSVLRAPV